MPLDSKLLLPSLNDKLSPDDQNINSPLNNSHSHGVVFSVPRLEWQLPRMRTDATKFARVLRMGRAVGELCVTSSIEFY